MNAPSDVKESDRQQHEQPPIQLAEGATAFVEEFATDHGSSTRSGGIGSSRRDVIGGGSDSTGEARGSGVGSGSVLTSWAGEGLGMSESSIAGRVDMRTPEPHRVPVGEGSNGQLSESAGHSAAVDAHTTSNLGVCDMHMDNNLCDDICDDHNEDDVRKDEGTARRRLDGPKAKFSRWEFARCVEEVGDIGGERADGSEPKVRSMRTGPGGDDGIHREISHSRQSSYGQRGGEEGYGEGALYERDLEEAVSMLETADFVPGRDDERSDWGRRDTIDGGVIVSATGGDVNSSDLNSTHRNMRMRGQIFSEGDAGIGSTAVVGGRNVGRANVSGDGCRVNLPSRADRIEHIALADGDWVTSTVGGCSGARGRRNSTGSGVEPFPDIGGARGEAFGGLAGGSTRHHRRRHSTALSDISTGSTTAVTGCRSGEGKGEEGIPGEFSQSDTWREVLYRET